MIIFWAYTVTNWCSRTFETIFLNILPPLIAKIDCYVLFLQEVFDWTKLLRWEYLASKICHWLNQVEILFLKYYQYSCYWLRATKYISLGSTWNEMNSSETNLWVKSQFTSFNLPVFMKTVQNTQKSIVMEQN